MIEEQPDFSGRLEVVNGGPSLGGIPDA